jgi:hypothetical protein
MYQNSKILAKYAFKVNRPWDLNVPIALIYPTTIQNMQFVEQTDFIVFFPIPIPN